MRTIQKTASVVKLVQLGLEEERSGIICLGTQAMFSGVKKWEQKHPDVAMVLKKIAEAHCQQEPSFKTSIAFTRLTASEAISQPESDR